MNTFSFEKVQDRISLYYFIAGGILFNLIFWQEKAGLNLLIFFSFLLAGLAAMYASSFKLMRVRLLLIASLVSLTSLLIANTELSFISCITCIGLLSAYVIYNHKSVPYAVGSILTNLALAPAMIADKWRPSKKGADIRNRFRFWRLLLLPVVLFTVFVVIYSNANSVFGKGLAQMSSAMMRSIEYVFTTLSWQRLLLILAGFYISATLVLRSNSKYFASRDLKASNQLQRVKNRNGASIIFRAFLGKFARYNMSFKYQYRIGLISLFLLNLLLLVVNVIDLNYIWINFNPDPSQPVYKLVHEGTELLILSIVLAMAVVLSFFGGNLNFYSQNRYLKLGAYAWIIQNALLVASVLMRDLYYIEKHGLAYKRLGVLFFLTMVMIGLISVFLKVALKKTNYYLFRVNSAALIVLLVCSSIISWDKVIARYNLEYHNGQKDIPFLLRLSDDALPALYDNQHKLEFQGGSADKLNSPVEIQSILTARRDAFLRKQESYSWLSWNLADKQVKNYFLNANPAR